MGFYVNRPVGDAAVQTGSSVTSKFDYITITTAVDIRLAADGSAASQAALDKVIEIVSTVAQPVIIGAPAASGQNYVLKLAIEHTGVWTATSLVNAIVAAQVSGTGFTSSNTSVVVATSF